jgi:predicted RND superfamily exporter protein
MRFSVISKLEALIFGNRRWVIGIFVIMTLFMAYRASLLRIDAGFTKHLPLKHEYMKTYVQYQQEFGGANRVVIAIMTKGGEIFTPAFFDVLRRVTDEVFFIPGIDRTQVKSLFTPNVRFTEVVEDGIAGGNVVPADFRPDPEGLAKVRENVLKSGTVGRLVANDFSGAVVSAQFLEFDPNTGERLNYIHAAHQLEKIREKFSRDPRGKDFEYHIIGFTKVMGDIADGAARVVLFFGVAFIITAVLVYIYSQSYVLTIISLACSLFAVIWQLGLLTLLGFGIDPMSILVPFLVFAIGVSHGVQMISGVRAEMFKGAESMEAAQASFRRLIVPGGIALASDTIGFITILLIDVRIIQEMAITASLGVAVIIFTNLFLLPVLLSYVKFSDSYKQKIGHRAQQLEHFWDFLSRVSEPRNARVVLGVSLCLFAVGAWKAADIKIGDLHRGVPELRSDSRYNKDSEVITNRFSVGVDTISVIVETIPEGCIDYEVMRTIDRFEWHMKNVEGVQSVIALPGIAKVINSGWNEGSLKWRVLPRNQSVLAQAVAYIPTSSGLMNPDCSVMPVLIFTSDHKAETIAKIVSEVKGFQKKHGWEKVRFRLATGNVGVMAATNEEVQAAQFPIIMYVFSAVIALCWITFRSLRGTLCVVIPLGIVSLLAYALMALLEIGLKVSTLPVVALGVGIGVDYGIYIFSRFKGIRSGEEPMEEFGPDGCMICRFENNPTLQEVYKCTLRITGSGVIFTGITLAAGVATWIFSPLKFQADMGILLTFMFLVNMMGAILLLPALASWLMRPRNNPEN